MKAAAPDFHIFWDNAYGVHHLTDSHDAVLNILDDIPGGRNGTGRF